MSTRSHTTTTCDGCGTRRLEVSDHNCYTSDHPSWGNLSVRQVKDGGDSEYLEHDLCPSCATKILAFLATPPSSPSVQADA
jgi:hypothetical protein